MAPCIVFIDEIDSLGAARGGVGTGKDGTLNQLLSELDGFDQKSGVVLIGATNLPEKLDKALLRPGRFDRIIHVPKPDIHGRREVILLSLLSYFLFFYLFFYLLILNLIN